MPVLNIGPTPAFIDYIADSCEGKHHPVKLALLKQGVYPFAITSSAKSLAPWFYPRWSWRWPFFTGHRPAVVEPSISRDLEGHYMVTLPEHTWPRASVEAAGYVYFLDNDEDRPILFARIYPPDGGLSVKLSDATVQSLGFCFHISK